MTRRIEYIQGKVRELETITLGIRILDELPIEDGRKLFCTVLRVTSHVTLPTTF